MSEEPVPDEKAEEKKDIGACGEGGDHAPEGQHIIGRVKGSSLQQCSKCGRLYGS